MPGGAEVFQLSPLQAGLSVVFGIVIGLLLGVVGGGGSILTVPVLVYVIGLNVQSATATSMAIVGVSALAGAIPHARAGRVIVRIALFFALFGVAGAFAGTWLNQRIDGPWILFLFGVLMLGVAARMWFRRPLSVAVLSTPARLSWKSPAAGLAVGLLTGFFGVGGGFLIVPALALALGMPMSVAVGTSLLIIALNSASGIAAHAGAGGLNVPVALLFIAGGLAGGLAGGRIAGRVDEGQLSRAFTFLVALVGVYLATRNGLLLLQSAM